MSVYINILTIDNKIRDKLNQNKPNENIKKIKKTLSQSIDLSEENKQLLNDELEKIKISKTISAKGTTIEVRLEARSFLHNQVRSIVGTLEKVGSKVWPPERVESALASRNRSECGPVAPPSGLYLTHIDYPRNVFSTWNQ